MTTYNIENNATLTGLPYGIWWLTRCGHRYFEFFATKEEALAFVGMRRGKKEIIDNTK